jgi:hypothetical protein
MMRSLWIRGLKTIAIALLLTSVGFCQNEQKTGAAEQNKTSSADTADTYRIEVTIRETQDGKPVSSRNYSSLIREGRYLAPRTIRIGSRLPAGTPTGNQGVNYFDVGTNLTFRVWKMEGQVILSMAVEVSNIAPAESTSNAKPADYPIIRQFRTEQEAAIPLGKPTLLNSVDDPSSNHKFQIEVTATKEKV